MTTAIRDAMIADVDYVLDLPPIAQAIREFLTTHDGAATIYEIKSATGYHDGLAVYSWLLALSDHGLVCSDPDSNPIAWQVGEPANFGSSPHHAAHPHSYRKVPA